MRVCSRMSVVRLLATVAAFLTVVSVVTAVAPPAAAAVSVDLAASSGTVGVTQTITVTVASTLVGSPTGRVTVTADGKTVGARAVGGDQGSTVRLSWTPTTTGPVTLRATFEADSNETATDQLTIQVNPVSTTTALSAPTAAAAHTKVSLTATVTATSGSYQPTGKVTFRTTGGTSLGSATLNANGVATLSYTTPAAAGTVTIVAEYAGDGKAAASASASASIKVSTTAVTMTLTAPAQSRVGTATTLTAKVTPASATGTVTFTANGSSIGSAKLSGGTARLVWKPTATGTFALVATYPGANGVGPGTATARIEILPALKTDTITVVPQGTTVAWSTSTPVTMRNGTSVTLLGSSASRLPVQLTVVGPCAFAANTLTVKGVGNPCTITASTKGNSEYAPAAQKYTVRTAIGAQTAQLTAPSSRTVRRHTSLRLGRVKATTDVGQPITWRVVSGTTRCHVKRTVATYRIVLSRPGTCRVRATAPAVAGQWASFSTTRTYRIR